MTTITLPRQPEAVREWIRRSRAEENRAFNTLRYGTCDPSQIIDRANEILGMLVSSFTMPPEIEAAYEVWRSEYNAAVAALNAERQRAANAREVAAIRSAACPRCFATHPGEC